MNLNKKGELIQNIEKNISQTTDYVQTAKVETEKAVVYQSKARRVSKFLSKKNNIQKIIYFILFLKKKIILIIVVIIIVVVILAIIIGTLVSKFKN